MAAQFRADLAMILPLPVPPAGPDDAVQFVDLAEEGNFFSNLESSFAGGGVIRTGLTRSAGRAKSPPLLVHEVGAFSASFVPSPGDFDRLDSRFRLPRGVWQALPQYQDYGFAVFKLRARRAPGLAGLLGLRVPVQHPHPMAMVLPRRDPQTLFFPTVHVHDTRVHEMAEFSHTLYCQNAQNLAFRLDPVTWDPSEVPLRAGGWGRKATNLVEIGSFAYRRHVLGKHPNRDIELHIG
jgi:hypothetical protein